MDTEAKKSEGAIKEGPSSQEPAAGGGAPGKGKSRADRKREERERKQRLRDGAARRGAKCGEEPGAAIQNFFPDLPDRLGRASESRDPGGAPRSTGAVLACRTVMAVLMAPSMREWDEFRQSSSLAWSIARILGIDADRSLPCRKTIAGALEGMDPDDAARDQRHAPQPDGLGFLQDGKISGACWHAAADGSVIKASSSRMPPAT
jgi:hypothetical protein